MMNYFFVALFLRTARNATVATIKSIIIHVVNSGIVGVGVSVVAGVVLVLVVYLLAVTVVVRRHLHFPKITNDKYIGF